MRLLLGLRELDLSHNQLEEVPAQLAKPPALARLSLAHNRLRVFPEAGGAAGGAAGEAAESARKKALGPTAAEAEAALCWDGLTSLDLSHNDLLEVPASLVANATRLVELFLDHNRLARLPRSAHLRGLVHLRKVCWGRLARAAQRER